jgi:hypothetical protein
MVRFGPVPLRFWRVSDIGPAGFRGPAGPMFSVGHWCAVTDAVLCQPLRLMSSTYPR